MKLGPINFSSFFSPIPAENTTDEIDKVILFTTSIVARQDLIAPILERYRNFNVSDPEGKLTNAIQTYLSLEEFIISNKPLIIKREFTRISLREEITKQVVLEKLPQSFRLLFLQKKEQLLSLLSLNTQSLAQYLWNQVGLKRLQDIVFSVLHDPLPSAPQVIDNKIDFSIITQNLTTLTEDDIISYFQRLNAALYQEISMTFGVKAAADITQKTYIQVKDRYDYELIAEYLKVIPQDVLQRERVTYMTRDELEKQATAAAEEKIRREVAEKSAKELSETVEELQKSKETILNLLHESQGLEKDLRDERDRANAIISYMNEGLFVVDKDFKITVINITACRLLNTSENEAIGKNILEFFPLYEGDKPLPHESYPVYRTIMEGKTVFVNIANNFHYFSNQERKFPVMISTSPLFERNSPDITGGVVIFRDITDTLKYEQALKDEKSIIEQKVKEQTQELTIEREQLKQAMEKVKVNYLQAQRNEAKLLASIKSLPLGFILTDANDGVIEVNNTAKTILELNNESETITNLAKLSSKFSFADIIGKCKSTKTPQDFKEVQHGDKFLHIIFAPIYIEQPNEEYIGTVILVQDITEEKQLERTKDEFFAIASHELRTPLTAIHGYSSLIKTSYSDKIPDKDILKMIGYIDESSVHLIDIVNEFLNVSRLEQGKIKFQIEPFSMTEVIDEVVHEVGELAQKKQLYLHVENAQEKFSNVNADKERTKQVVSNLIGNAIKFTETGGITINIEEKDNKIFVGVRDTGKGMSEKSTQQLFKKFQQTEDNIFLKDQNRGSGLGLYISKKIIENMSGEIYLKSSEVDKGSVFTFSLPVAKT